MLGILGKEPGEDSWELVPVPSGMEEDTQLKKDPSGLTVWEILVHSL